MNTSDIGYDTLTVKRFADEGRIEEWVHGYLTSGSWANPGFSEGLKKAKRWWYGPVEMPLSALSRAVGPEPGMEYQVSSEYWYGRTREMALSLSEPTALPPLIIEYRDGELSIRDGNTRYGAMSLMGWKACWVILWYNSESDFHNHTSILEGKPDKR